jgi:hypothetical protein
MHRSIYVPKVSRRSEDDHGITVYRPSAAVKSARERSTLASDDSQTRQGSGGKERPSVADEESAASAQAPAEPRSDGHRRIYSEPLEAFLPHVVIERRFVGSNTFPISIIDAHLSV